MMRRLVHTGLILIIALASMAPVRAAPADEATAVVERLHGRLVEVAATETAMSLEQRYEALAPVIRETHNLKTMGRLTVRRSWRGWSEDQRAAFSDAFERLSITTYASRFADIGPDVFAVLSASEAGKEIYDVNAVIRRTDAEDVPMRYQLQLEGEDWRITNVFADGVSELSLMRSEYFDILESGGLEDLLSELESQIAAL